MRPAASSSQAQQSTKPRPSGAPASASTRPGPSSWRKSISGAHSARPRIQVTPSPSRKVGTSPAGGRSTATAVRSRASSQLVPTSGWPAKGSSAAGVKIRTRPARGSSTNTVSLKPRSAATAWRRPSGTAAPSRNTPSGFPPVPSGATNTRSTCSSAMATGYPAVPGVTAGTDGWTVAVEHARVGGEEVRSGRVRVARVQAPAPCWGRAGHQAAPGPVRRSAGSRC